MDAMNKGKDKSKSKSNPGRMSKEEVEELLVRHSLEAMEKDLKKALDYEEVAAAASGDKSKSKSAT